MLVTQKWKDNLKNGTSEIDGYRIETVTSEFNRGNILRMTVGTNCPRGGDAGHGGRTVIMLNDAGGTEMRCTKRGALSWYSSVTPNAKP